MTDPDTGIPDLIRRLSDDSKRLVTDEVRLAKIETKEGVHRMARGALWLGLAFGTSVVMLVALTIFLSTLIGRAVNGHMWLGALITGLVELAAGGYLIKRAVGVFAEPSYTMAETRHALADTGNWVGPPGRGARERAPRAIRSVAYIVRNSSPLLALLASLLLPAASVGQGNGRTIAIDERLAADAGIHLGDRVVLTALPGGAGDTATVAAIVKRRADPAEIARGEYRVRLHLTQLQQILGYGDRVDRFAVGTRSDSATGAAIARINAAAFGFRAHRSRDIAVETSKTFAVVSRFHRAIGVITVVASAIFLLCIMLLKVEERRRDVAALRLMGISARTVERSIVLEAAAVAVLGSLAGVGVGAFASWLVNRHYQAVYRTPLRFSIVTGDVVLLAIGLSIVLGIGAGWLATRRLVKTPPLTLFGR